jgi:Xaa-Pro aminopeptidase
MSNFTTSTISFGPMQVDWEIRVDFEKMRKERLELARKAMAAADVDFLVLVRTENCRYTTGIKRLYWPTIRLGGGPALVIPREGDAIMVYITDTDFASKSLPWLRGDMFRDGCEFDWTTDVARFAREVKEVYGQQFETATVGVDIWTPAMNTVLHEAFPKVRFVNGQETMIQARKNKTAEEITCMKMGYVISEAGMQAAVGALKAGVRECELVGVCFNKFWELGSETSQCSEVVTSGPGTYPYRRFHTDRIVQWGEFVVMDFGACFAGYFGDFARAFVCGGKPSQKQKDILKRAYDLQMEALNGLRPGVSPAQICKELGRKSFGHGIGIAAFEVPHLRHTDDYIIEPGMTFSVTTPVPLGEPGLGVHLEDETFITEKGCEVYSTYPYPGVNFDY